MILVTGPLPHRGPAGPEFLFPHILASQSFRPESLRVCLGSCQCTSIKASSAPLSVSVSLHTSAVFMFFVYLWLVISQQPPSADFYLCTPKSWYLSVSKGSLSRVSVSSFWTGLQASSITRLMKLRLQGPSLAQDPAKPREGRYNVFMGSVYASPSNASLHKTWVGPPASRLPLGDSTAKSLSLPRVSLQPPV